MSRHASFFVHFAIIMAFLCGTGAHWMVLQTVAWTNMLITYSKDATLTEAIGKTFDGEHPCNLCHEVREAEKQSKDQEASYPFLAIKGILSPTLVLFLPGSVPLSYPRSDTEATPRPTHPLIQPPRTALA